MIKDEPNIAPASIFLRLGVTLVAFMTLFCHLLFLALVPQLKCNGDEPPIWVVTFLTAFIAFVAALSLLAARPLKSVVQALKWGCIPLLILMPFGLFGVLPVFGASTLGGAPICPGISAHSNLVWQQAWAPLQMGLLVIIAIQVARYRYMAREQAEAARILGR